jgi:hypothetical protein
LQPSSVGTPQRGVGKRWSWPNHGINHCVVSVIDLLCLSFTGSPIHPPPLGALKSGAPPDNHCSCPVRDPLPYQAHPTVAPRGWLAHRTQSSVPNRPLERDTRRPQITQPTVGHERRRLTGQSGAPPDSLVNFSHIAFFNSRDRRVRRG